MPASQPLFLARLIRLALPAAVAAAVACAARQEPSLASLCSGSSATATVEATIDTTRPPAGAALTAAKGERFTMHFTFTPAGGDAALVPAGDCTGRTGTATTAADLPAMIRNASSSSRHATWRIEDDTILLDLNPGTRDNNIFVAIPLHGGRGHWGLSTIAGEVASGATTTLPQR